MAENLYTLPNNWRLEKLNEIIKLLSGQDLQKDEYNSVGNGIPYITGASNFDRENILINRWTDKPTVIAKKGDILVTCKGSVGKTAIADFEIAHIARQIMALRVSEKANNFFVHYFLKSMYEELKGNERGLIPGISRKVILNFSIPLPPLDEQKRIVTLLDSFFEKLDAAKEVAKAVIDSYELRRAAILHKAFTGELSEKWRVENGFSLDDWQEKNLGEILSLSREKTETFDANLKYVGLENIEKNGGKISFQSADEIKSTKNIFYSGDLLYGKLRPYLNKHGIPNFDGVCSTDILVFNSNELSCNEFINYFFNLPNFIEYAVSNSKGLNDHRLKDGGLLWRLKVAFRLKPTKCFRLEAR